MAFDTLRCSPRLQPAGISRQQAEAHVEPARDMVIADPASKADLAAAVKELQAEMKLLEQRMTITLGVLMAAGAALVVTPGS